MTKIGKENTGFHGLQSVVSRLGTISLASLSIAVLVGIVYVASRQKSVVLSSGKLDSDVWCVKDDADTLFSDEVLNLPNEQYLVYEGETPNFGFYRGSVWVIFNVQGEADRDSRKIVEVKSPVLNHFEAYEIWPNNAKRFIVHSGDDEVFTTRPLDHRNYQFVLDIPKGEAKQILMEVSSAGEQLLLPISVWESESLAARDNIDTLIRGSYFGLVIFVLLFNLFIYLIIREKSSLYYLMYNLTLLMLQFSLSGYAFQYFWPNNTYLANIANPLFASLSVFAMLRFSQAFLNLLEYYPRINKIFNGLGYLLLANAGLTLIYLPSVFSISILVVNGMAFVLNLVILPITFLVLRKNFKPAKFFMLAFVVLIFTVFGFLLSNFGIIRNEFVADYGLLVGSAAEVILLSFAIVDRFKTFKDEALERLVQINKITEEAKEQLEIKVQERTEQILIQKKEIEDQKDEIVSSIRYDERIQKSLFPTEETFQSLFGEAFVFFQPKDIVSGDFYWAGSAHRNGQHNDTWNYFAAADCTGHGVPGAFMSVMGYNLLQQSITRDTVADPGASLTHMHESIIEKLQSQGEDGSVGDGMDIVLAAIQPEKKLLHYAGANLNLFIWRKGDLIKLEGDRMGIGFKYSKEKFTTHSFQLEEGDFIMVSSDGFKDQFGGVRQKKLQWSGFTGLINDVARLSAREQKKRLEKFFHDWKGDLEQVDDLCVLGFRFSSQSLGN